MKKIIILLAVSLLFIIACDVLNHDVYHNGDLENFFTDFTTAFDNIDEDNVDAVMVYYDENYLHRMNNISMTKEMMHSFYLELFQKHEGSARFYTDLVSYNKYNDIYWDLLITWETSDSTITELIEFKDTYVNSEEEILLFGNQIDPPELDSAKTVVFVEYGTGESCGNCPPIGAKLTEMRNSYGGQFIYVEYCQYEPDAPVDHYWNFARYYSAYTQPYTIMQGTFHNNGGAQTNVDLLESQYLEFVDNDPEAFITNIIWNEDNPGIIAGSVDLTMNNISLEDLKLRVFVINEHPDLHYHADGSAMHDVVFAVQEISISTSGTVNYSLEYLQEDYPELPEKASLIFALQTKSDVYNSDTCKVYTAAEKKLYED